MYLFIYLFSYLFNYLFIIYSINFLFISFIYQIFIRNKLIKNLSGYISENFLYIMINNKLQFKLCSF